MSALPGTPAHMALWMQPRLFTREAWVMLTDAQRALVLARRRMAVDVLQADHLARYHHGGRLADLAAAVYGPPDDAA